MAQVETMGRAAFFKEKQNQPLAASGRTFQPEQFIRFTLLSGRLELEAPTTRQPRVAPPSAKTGGAVQGELPLEFDEQAPPPTMTRVVPLSDLVIFGFLDSALGRDSLRGDFAAIATVGRAPDGSLHTLDLWMDRVPLSRQAEIVFDLHAEWNYTVFGFESNSFQSSLGVFIEEERERRRAAGCPWKFGLIEVPHKISKINRIGLLEPHAKRGWLTFNRTLPDEFWIEAEQFPHSEHDDALDALAAAVELALPPRGTGEIRTVSRP
jgi:predicted phage terminase large subunit-like protein